jgi:hypothetical protein
VKAVDLAGNLSEPSNTIRVWVPDPRDRMNIGQSEPSPYTMKRIGYHGWGKGVDSTADFGGILKYRFTDWQPEYDYALGFGVFEPAFDSGRVFSVKSGAYCFPLKIIVPESLLYVCYPVPKQLYEQGILDIALYEESYEAVLAEILIWEKSKKSGGPQSSGSDQTNSFYFDVIPLISQGKVTIQYSLSSSATAVLAIYDCAGKLVYRQENIRCAGMGQVQWDSNGIAAGVYFVSMTTDNARQIRKAIIVR